MNKNQHRKRYIKKQKKDTTSPKDDELDLLGEGDGGSFTGSNADLESAADNLFTSPPRPQRLPFSSLSLKLPAKTVPPTLNLDLPPPRQLRTTSNVEQMEVDYGPALPPHLGGSAGSFLVQPRSLLRRLWLDLKNTHSHRKHDVDPRSASDQYNDDSDEPRISSSKSKKHADKSKHKVRSRYVSSSSEEDQSSVARHRSSKPSGAISDQDQPQHDPDPPSLIIGK